MFKDVERCLENHFSLEDRESSLVPTQLSQVSEVYGTLPSQCDPGGITQPHPGSPARMQQQSRLPLGKIKDYHYHNVQHGHAGPHGHGPARTQIHTDEGPYERRSTQTQAYRDTSHADILL